MKATLSIVAGMVLVLGLTACSGVDSRIEDNQAAFDAYPAETQAAIRAEKVLPGFTPAQVEIALGKPDRTYTRTTEKGSSEVWAYEKSSPTVGVGLGFGVGTGVGSTGRIGTGVGIGTQNDRGDDRLRVVFEGGTVLSVEELKD